MDHFQYRNGLLHAEEVPLPTLAAAVGTPFYCYSTATIERHYRVFLEGFAGLDARVFYALKANSNQAVIATLARLGAGADVVSGGELKRALAAGVPGGRIVFSGVGKTEAEMVLALDSGIFQFNVESEPELRALSALAAARGQTAAIAVRVNPDVDAATHAKITTGKRENKFGIPWQRAPAIYRLAQALPGIRPLAVSVHIGSQLTELAPYAAAFRRVRELAEALNAEGIGIERVDLGGGLGIVYRDEAPPSPADYARLVREVFAGLPVKLMFEPGRMIVGNAGILVASVIYVKQEGRRFVIVDAAMNDLIRPTLYDAWHEIVAVRAPAAGAAATPADIVGPVCESGDFLAQNRPLPPVAPGDLIAVRTAGAYGAVQASTYNTRALAPEVLVRGEAFAVVRPRVDAAALIALDRLPPWLARAGGGGAQRAE